MATLNNSATTEFDDDGDEGASRKAVDPILTWNWVTWPANLRRALSITLSILLISAALIALVRWADKDFAKKLKQQQEQKVQAQTQLKNSGQERSDIEKHLPLLRQLEASNVFGEEKRLEWVEHLRAIEKRMPGVRLQYNIAVQNLQQEASATAAPVNPTAVPIAALLPNGEPAKSFGVFTTDMKLTLKVLHEGDVLAIIEDLKQAGLGRFTVKQCNFKRAGGSAAASSLANVQQMPSMSASVDAECTLSWLSMRAYTPS